MFLAGIVTCKTALAQPAPAKSADPPTATKAAEATPEPPKATPVSPNGTENGTRYDQDSVNDTAAFKRNVGTKALLLLSPTEKLNAGNQAAFDQYYNEYLLARWSQVKNVSRLLDFRRELHNNLVKARSGEVHDHLNTLALEYLNKLATGNYHPVVQVNAMLMIGDLNKEEGVGTAAKPLPAALDVMLADVQNAKVSDAVRAEAIIGIQRHVAMGITDEEVRRPLTAAMLKLVAAADSADRRPYCRPRMDLLPKPSKRSVCSARSGKTTRSSTPSSRPLPTANSRFPRAALPPDRWDD